MAASSPPLDEVGNAIAQASRELSAFVNAAGAIQWSDARAERLGLVAGAQLADVVVPGCEDKARALCRQGCSAAIAAWELPLVDDGVPMTAVFRAQPVAGGAVLVGSLIAQDYAQVDSPLQRATRGTGLGLSLSKKLAESLGGRLEVDSAVNVGSTFTVTLPMEHAQIAQYRQIEEAAREIDPSRAPVLVVEDDRSIVFAYERYLSMSGFQVVPVRSTDDARRALARITPSAILLDVMLDGEDTWQFLADIKGNPATSEIPVLVCTVMNRESRARALGADEFWLKPVDEDRLIRKLQSLATGRGARVLVVDDDPAARYLIQRFLKDTPYELLEAATGREAIEHARARRPDVILLDFLLEETTAFDVIDQLKSDPSTRGIPVVIVTSHALPAADRARLSEHAESILSKEHLSRELAITRIRDALRNAGIHGKGAS